MWDTDRYAIIAFLLLSVDEIIGADGLEKLGRFMGIAETKTGGDADNRLAGLRAARDEIVRQGNAFLENIDGDDVRYDCVTEELDNVIDGNENLGIAGRWWWLMPGHAPGETAAFGKLEGSADRLFHYLRLVFFDEDYRGGNKKRFLKYLAKKWGIRKSILPTLEDCARSLDGINRRRFEIGDSDMPHREAVAVLAGLDAREESIRQKLGELRVMGDGLKR